MPNSWGLHLKKKPKHQYKKFRNVKTYIIWLNASVNELIGVGAFKYRDHHYVYVFPL